MNRIQFKILEILEQDPLIELTDLQIVERSNEEVSPAVIEVHREFLETDRLLSRRECYNSITESGRQTLAELQKQPENKE